MPARPAHSSWREKTFRPAPGADTVRSDSVIPMKISNGLLGAIGVAGFIACVLACRPEFSPDGKKVAFGIMDKDSKSAAVMVCDLAKGTVESVFARPSQAEQVYAAASWTTDSRNVVVCTAEGDEVGRKAKGPFLVNVVPVEGRGPTRVIPVLEDVGVLSLVYHPPLLRGEHLFLAGKQGVTRLNTRTGEIKWSKMIADEPGEDEALILFGEGETIYYLNGLNHRLQIGSLDPETLKASPLLEIAESKCNPFPAISWHNRRIALGFGEESEQTLRLYRDGALERTIVVGTANEPINLGNLVWSADDATIYAAYCATVNANETAFGFCEIPVNGEKIRKIPLFKSEAKKDSLIAFQVGVSPDGKWLAAHSASADFSSPEDQAFYMVDLRAAARPVTRRQIPEWKR
jgi:hypothetical protein